MDTPNLTYIKNLSAGDLEFEKKLIDIIKTELPAEIEVYKNSVGCLNFKDTAEIVHKLKHKISILGLETSYETAVAYENNLLNSSLELKSDFESTLKKMSLFINQL